MQTKLTERQQRFINMAATHADDFKTRVAQHDQESSFPHENVEAMKASGYTALIVPEELGGRGAKPLDIALAQERLAYGDLPMAIAVNMHHIAVALIADLWWLNQKGEGLKLDAIEPMLGGAALFKKNPLEQMYRDVRAAIIHQPFAGTEGKALLGRRAFGLPVYGLPRFV